MPVGLSGWLTISYSHRLSAEPSLLSVFDPKETVAARHLSSSGGKPNEERGDSGFRLIIRDSYPNINEITSVTYVYDLLSGLDGST
jgi:hypothetical protein